MYDNIVYIVKSTGRRKKDSKKKKKKKIYKRKQIVKNLSLSLSLRLLEKHLNQRGKKKEKQINK